MLQLFDALREGCLPTLLGRLSRVLAAQVFKISVSVGIRPQLLREAPDAGIAEDIRIDAVFLEDAAHRLAIHELPVGHPLEFGGESDPSGDNAGNERAIAEFGDFFGIELLFCHSAPFSPDDGEHYYSRTDTVMRCP